MRLVVLVIWLTVVPTMAIAGDNDPPRYKERSDRKPADLLRLGELLAADFWNVLSAPARFDRNDWLKTAAAAAAFTALYQYDADIHRTARRNRDGGILKAVEDVGNDIEYLGLMGKTGRFYGAGIVAGYVFKWEKLERVSTDILFSHFVGGMIRQGFIRVFDRSRPHENKGAYNYGNGGTSMPSGHSSTIFQLATVLSHHFPNRWAQILFYGLASSVVVQRVTVEQHWASDSFLGAVYGYAVARTIVATNDRREYLVAPYVNTDAKSVGVSIRFGF